MELRFVGMDGLGGLRENKIYDCEIRTRGHLVYLTCDPKGLYGRFTYGYRSFKSLFEDWEEVIII